MLHNVTTKSLYDQRRSLLAWAVSLVLLVAMYVAIWPSIRDQPAMTDFLNSMPPAMRSLFAMTGADMTTPIGYVKIEMLSLMAPLLVLLYAVTTGAAAIAGEEDRHTLDMLLANPVSRGRVLLEKLAAMTAGIVLLAAVTGAALLLESPMADMRLPAGPIIAARFTWLCWPWFSGLWPGPSGRRPGTSPRPVRFPRLLLSWPMS